jgi:hypothetical protein
MVLVLAMVLPVLLLVVLVVVFKGILTPIFWV